MVLVVAVFTYILVREGRAQRRADFDLRVSATSAAIRLAVESALRSGTPADVERLANDLVAKQSEIVRIRFLDRSLAPRVDANLLAGDPGVPLDRHRQVRDTGQPAVVEHQGGGSPLHTMLLPVRSSGNDEGVLEIAFVASRLEADLLGENYTIALRGGVLLLLLGLVVWVALRPLVFAPVSDLMQRIEGVAADGSRAPVRVGSRDRLGKAGAALNRMTGRL
jgi:methyl-accepting chemotaxis protein